MNIDNLLNLKSGVFAHVAGGEKVTGEVIEVLDDDQFVFSPKGDMPLKEGTMVRLSDGQDSILAKVLELLPSGIKMALECYVSPGDERRQDARVYDKVYLKVKFLSHAERKTEALADSMEKIMGNRLIINSFIKGNYSYPGKDEMPFSIHMFLADDFSELMRSVPRDVNISASGLRFIAKESFKVGDIIEMSLILPMAPLLYLHLVGDVLRVKSVTSYGNPRYAVAARFLQIDTDTKEDIIKYLFRRQREFLRRRQD